MYACNDFAEGKVRLKKKRDYSCEDCPRLAPYHFFSLKPTPFFSMLSASLHSWCVVTLKVCGYFEDSCDVKGEDSLRSV